MSLLFKLITLIRINKKKIRSNPRFVITFAKLANSLRPKKKALHTWYEPDSITCKKKKRARGPSKTLYNIKLTKQT